MITNYFANEITQNTNLNKIQTALDPIASLAYAPPHDYPMSLPIFKTKPKIERFRPETDTMRLYVHIPFCNYGCSFCTFAKGVGASEKQMSRYVQALKKELEWIPSGMTLSQLFMGGGTPTVLTPSLLDELLTAIFERMEKMQAKPISPHQLRHFLLTWLKKQGIDDALIQPYSGHSSRQSLEVYSRLSIGEAQEIYNQVMMQRPLNCFV